MALFLPCSFSVGGKQSSRTSCKWTRMDKHVICSLPELYKRSTNVPCPQWRALASSQSLLIREKELERKEPETSTLDEIERLKSLTKKRLHSIDNGDISISPYDTAWVALAENVREGAPIPQFPSSLQWIVDNQLPDGSWGDRDHFSAYDRLVCTLACVVALKKWNSNPEQSERGLIFVKENICKLENEKLDHMTIGFEVVFPALMDLAKGLDIEVPHDHLVMQQIYESRAMKLERIPRDILHTVHTSLLFSLEGLTDLNWEKLFKLQCTDGSFLYSPASTASALAHTNDRKCLNYLERIVERFNGGVPYIYPVDIFARNWTMDRLQRLGVSRYFQTEFKEFLSYVYRQLTEKGLYSVRDAPLYNIDDTAMAWRLLRLYGYDVSPDVFQHFRKGNEFFTFAMQASEAVTSMFQLYRASQFMFPGEKILEDAKDYSYNFLLERHSKSQIIDKWLICKDLPGEVEFLLDTPWYANLPRIETRFYIEQYGGKSDVWIGKVFYRMGDINNDDYLEFAKLDYNYCQGVHQREWDGMHKWYRQCNLKAFGISSQKLLFTYFVASASIFEPERSGERIAWAKTSILIDMISYYLEKEESFDDQKKTFTAGLNCMRDYSIQSYSSKTAKLLMETLCRTIQDLSMEAETLHDRRIKKEHLCDAWKNWLMAWEDRSQRCPEDAQLLVRTIITFDGRSTQEEILAHPQYKYLSDLMNKICHHLQPSQNNNLQAYEDYPIASNIRTAEVDGSMQELVQQVLTNSDNGIDSGVKQTFLTICKSFYYSNLYPPNTIKSHVDKVLFQRIL